MTEMDPQNSVQLRRPEYILQESLSRMLHVPPIQFSFILPKNAWQVVRIIELQYAMFCHFSLLLPRVQLRF
jgi:hypothetical protein